MEIICFNVKTVAKEWIDEMSWTIESCIGNKGKRISCHSHEYDYNDEYNLDHGKDNEKYEKQCCLPKCPVLYTITCKDSHGDGWHGGYIEINGKKYCEAFDYGHEKIDATWKNNWQNESSMICHSLILSQG